MANVNKKSGNVLTSEVLEGAEGITLTMLGKSLTIHLKDLSADILAQAACHGLKQKLSDAAALKRDTDTGLSATPAEKLAAVQAVYDRLMGENPSWNSIRESGSGGGDASLLVDALAYIQKTDKAKIIAWLDKKDKEQIAALRKNPKVAAEMARIRAERLAAKADDSYEDDLDEMLEGLDDSTDTDTNTDTDEE